MTNKAKLRHYVVLDSKTNKDGLSKVYIRFFQDNKKKDYSIGVKWPRENWDPINELLTPRYVGDPDCEANNLIIAQYKAIIHQINVQSFVDGHQPVLQKIIDSLNNLSPYTDFISFANAEMRRKYRANVNSYETYKNHRAVFRRLVAFFGRETIGIDELTIQKIEEFDGYYRKIKRANNTVAAYHKVIKTYLTAALEQNLIKHNPYEKFKFRFVASDRQALTQEEVKELMTIYKNNVLGTVQQEVLRRFLFSCLTGLRISDTHQIQDTHIIDNKIRIQPKKGLKQGKFVVIPIPPSARVLIENRKGFLFPKITDQAINRNLKIVAAYARISTNVTYHTARYTFGTIFIELGGDVQTLCNIMGHHSIKITEIYLKTAEQRKVNLMANFDLLFK